MKVSWAELRRRKVVRVAIAYIISAWVLLQVGDTLFGLLEFPGWAGRALVAALAVGLPAALILAWMFDITPSGVVATADEDDTSEKRFNFAELGTIEIDQLDLGRPQLTPLIGRTDECATLAARLDAAAAGSGGVVLIGGEPGVGKTRLGEEALELGLARGMLPLVGHAYEEHGAPYITSTEILEDIRRALPPEVLRSALGDTAAEIARLLPDLHRTFPDLPEPAELPPEQQQRFLFNAMLDFTARLARACPLVILLDDLQWADESSGLLLEHLAPHLPGLPMLLVITYRDVAADMGEPFKRALAHLSRQDFATRIRLRQLGRDEVAALLEDLAGSAAPPAVVDVIHQETAGNAFFVKSVFQHLAEEGCLFDGAGHWLTDIDTEQLPVPEGVRLVTERRLQRLGEVTVKTLTVAAVMGLRFDLGVLERVFGDASHDVLEAVEGAETAGMVFAAGGQREASYEFAHALVRQTLLEELSAARRQRVHLQIATAMEQLWGDGGRNAADIARHLYRAGNSADAGKTRHFLELTGQQALAAAAASEAIDAFGQALELDVSPGQRAQLLYQRGSAWRISGQWEEAAKDWLEALPIFEELGENELIARICWDIAYKHSWDNELGRGQAIAYRGLAAVGEEPSVARCQLLAAFGMCAGERLDYRVWESHVEQAIAMAEQLGEERLLGCDILAGKQYLGEHWLKAGLHAETADRAIELVRRVGSPWELSTILGASFLGYMGNGRFDDVERNVPEALELARKHGDFGTEMHAQITHGLVQCYRGDLPAGRATLRERAEWARSVDFAWKTVILELLGMAEFWLGDWDSARNIADEINEQPILGTMAGWEAAFGLVLAAYAGDSSVDALIERLQPRVCIAGQENQIGSWFAGIAMLESAAVLGQRKRCADLYPCAVQLGGAGTHVVMNLGLAERHAGIAAAAGGEWARAGHHFDIATHQAETMKYAMELAELPRWRAQMLLWRNQPGDREQAHRLLSQAQAAYGALGMRRHVTLAEAMAAESGNPIAR